MCLIKSLELLRGQLLSIIQQSGASVFHTVVHQHKSGEVDNECILHNSIILAICVPKILNFDGDLRKFGQKQVGNFFGPSLTLQPAVQHSYSIIIDRRYCKPTLSYVWLHLNASDALLIRYTTADVVIETGSMCATV